MDTRAKKEKTLQEMEKQCIEDSERWFGDTPVVHSIPHHSLALAGEVGEFCNIVKKIDRGSLDMRSASVRHAMAMEITDTFVYLLNIAGLMGIDLAKTYDLVRAQNEERFMKERAARNGD